MSAAEVYHEPTPFICFVHPASREPVYEIDQHSMWYSRTRNMMSGHFGRLVQVSRLGGSIARPVRTILGSTSLAGGQSVEFSGMLECGRADLISHAGQAMPSTIRVSDACALNFPVNGRTGFKSRVPGRISGQRSPESLASRWQLLFNPAATTISLKL